jgi:AraC-like DNA-binding protein
MEWGTEQAPGPRVPQVVVTTHRRDEAPRLLARTFPALRLEIPPSDGPFAFRHSALGDARLTASELVLSGPAAAHGALRGERVAVGQVLAGDFEAVWARHRIDPALPFLRPTGPASLRMHDVHLRLVELDAAAVRERAARAEESGAPHVRLVRTRPGSAAAAVAWRWVADRVHDTVRDPRAVASPIVMGELFDLAARMLLRCFGDVPEVPGPSTATAPAAVRRAVAFLEDHAASPVSMPEVAAAARVSVRSLQSLFRRHLGTTPLEHLHGIRLEAARRELLEAGDPRERMAVRDVAARWGFGNSGRFARNYAARFGERPSETLRRAR